MDKVVTEIGKKGNCEHSYLSSLIDVKFIELTIC